ncbi:hypothetical protein E2C01_077605 [Portunus trituberculatus]|uniref:MADF domain-containing protein n=1 Tax=Portunus trituberculatus TaxID=210409 RepID=A0A5B7IMS5_PORTR|nr:hypothetical protein [Portunus trituberculatus]
MSSVSPCSRNNCFRATIFKICAPGSPFPRSQARRCLAPEFSRCLDLALPFSHRKTQCNDDDYTVIMSCDLMWSRPAIVLLCEMVESHRCLWDPKNADYPKHKLRLKLFADITQDIDSVSNNGQFDWMEQGIFHNLSLIYMIERGA